MNCRLGIQTAPVVPDVHRARQLTQVHYFCIRDTCPTKHAATSKLRDEGIWCPDYTRWKD